jgi:hypothetical protein
MLGTIILHRHNPFGYHGGGAAKEEVMNILTRMTLLLAGKALRILDQEPVSNSERRHALRKFETLRRLQKEALPLNVMETGMATRNPDERVPFENWKPKLFPLDDATIEDEIILEIIE